MSEETERGVISDMNLNMAVSCSERFQAAERSDWRKTSEQVDNMADLQHVQTLWTTRDVSVRVHEGFR